MVALLVLGASLGPPAPVRAQGRARTAAAPRTMMRPSFDPRTGLAEPGLTALIAASNKGDRNEIVRLAERMGVARIASVLTLEADRASERAQVIAALDAARVLEGGVRLLAPVTRLLADGDSRVAEKAARAVGELLRADRLDKLIEWEITAEEVYNACATLARTASNASAATPLRIAAIEALGEAHVYCRGDLRLGGATSDSGPDVRRAALLAPQITDSESLDAIAGLLDDPVPLVAGAAGTVWCRNHYDALRRGAVKNEPERMRLFRMRMLVSADVAAPEDASEMIPCLALSKDPEDQKVVEAARKRSAGAGMQRW